MIPYLLTTTFAVLFIAVLFYLQFRKRQVFDKYIDLDVSLEFTESTTQKGESRYGLILFNIHEIRKDFRAITINQVKIHSNKLQLRSHNHISTKLPLPNQGIVLSVGVKKIKKLTKNEIESLNVTISGFLFEDKNKKKAFKRKLIVLYRPSSKILPLIHGE